MISVSGLTYSYPGAVDAALSDVDIEVARGEFVILAGASGSGKSTLLRAIAGLVPHFHGGHFAGRVSVNGLDTREHRPSALAAEVASLFQDPETQIVMASVRAELTFGLENRGWSAAAIARGVEETALSLAIDGLLDRPTAELSGGECQRVALGATLAGRPHAVCLDEPTSQLDPVAGDELIGLLRRLNEDGDLTVVMSEHRLERCLPAADRVIALASGRVAFDGPPGAFLAWAIQDAPALATPGARLLVQAGLAPVAGVKAARAALRGREPGGLEPHGREPGGPEPGGPEPHRRDACHKTAAIGRKRDTGEVALAFTGVWHEVKNGPQILRGVDLELRAGERVALMGANGAGKSTLLKHAAGLLKPTRGRVDSAGRRVALLLQNPNDYLVHDTVAQEADPAALARFDLSHLHRRHPRDLSGGERQRLALAIVCGTDMPAVLCLDEPTRGMDRSHRDQLIALIDEGFAAVLIATHDPEFAAGFADRVLLLGAGRLIADGTPQEILAGGTYFATEAARITDGRVLVP
jgi:energy-coupling factor transporter ATP-binding protein EcfA2